MGDIIPVQAPNGLADIITHYGDPKITRNQDGSWAVDAKWESDNMVIIAHPMIPARQSGRLYIHKLAAPSFIRVLNRWQARIDAGDPYRVKTLGCFNPRAQRGSNGLLASMHTWGAAVDLNADDNPMISPCDPDDPRRQTETDIPRAWFDDWIAEGWFMGRDFQHRFDPQHGQLAQGY